MHAQESHCLHFPFYQARERERNRGKERETEREIGESVVCVFGYKNITIVLTVNSQLEGSGFESPPAAGLFCEAFKCSHVCSWFFLWVLWPPPTVRDMHSEERHTGDWMHLRWVNCRNYGGPINEQWTAQHRLHKDTHVGLHSETSSIALSLQPTNRLNPIGILEVKTILSSMLARCCENLSN